MFLCGRRCGRPCGSGSVWTATRCARAAGTSSTPGTVICYFLLSGNRRDGLITLTSNLTPGAAPPATDPWRAATSHWVSLHMDNRDENQTHIQAAYHIYQFSNLTIPFLQRKWRGRSTVTSSESSPSFVSSILCTYLLQFFFIVVV